MTLTYQLSILWMLSPIGLSVHVLVALLPLFAGGDVREASLRLTDVPRQARMMVITAVIPMIMAVSVVSVAAMPLRWLNLGLAVLLTLANTAHLFQHLHLRPPDHTQNALLTVILILSAILTYLSYLWVVAE